MLIVPSSATSTACVRTSSSPSTQWPSLTRNFQLCQAHVSSSPSRSPVVRPYPSCGQALSRAWMPVEVWITHNLRPSTLTSFIAPIGNSARLPTTVARACTSMLMSRTVRLQVSLKSSDDHIQTFRSPAVDDRRDRAPGGRRHIGAALLRDRGPDPLRAQRVGPPPLPRRRAAPGQLHPHRPAGRPEPWRDPRGAVVAARRAHAQLAGLGPTRPLLAADSRPADQAPHPYARPARFVHRLRMPVAHVVRAVEPRRRRRHNRRWPALPTQRRPPLRRLNRPVSD